jgi:WD40 repeat protein
MLVTSTSDGVVRGWKYQPTGFQLAEQPDNQEEFVEHQFGMEVYCMAWDELNEVLYCGLKNGGISMWNFKTDTERPMLPLDAVEDRREAHTMMIMDMITMPKLQFMASGGMDGKLVLWDTINHKIKWVYKEHTRGILTLSFNESLILLFSAGFDHQICIWNPYIPTLIHKIQGHLSPILSIKVI